MSMPERPPCQDVLCQAGFAGQSARPRCCSVMLAFCRELHYLAFDLLYRSSLWVSSGVGQALKEPAGGCGTARPCWPSGFGSAWARLSLAVPWSARRRGLTLFVFSFAPALHSPFTRDVLDAQPMTWLSLELPCSASAPHWVGCGRGV